MQLFKKQKFRVKAMSRSGQNVTVGSRFQKLVSKSGVQLQTPMMTPTFRLLGVARFAVFVAFF